MIAILILLTVLVPQTHENSKVTYYSPGALPSLITATNTTGKPTLKIGSFVNYGGNTMPMGPISPEGMRIALDAIQKAGILTDYELVIEAHDDKMCENGDVVKRMIEFLDGSRTSSDANVVPIVSGPACANNAYIGQFLKYYNFVGLADATIILEISTNKRKYDSFYQLRPSFETFYEAIPAFLKSNGWNQVYLLTEAFKFWNVFEETLQYNLMKQNISLAGTSKVILVTEGLPGPEHFQQAVSDLAAFDPRIVIVDSHFGALIACWLHRYRLYGPGHVLIFFGPAHFLPNSMPRGEGCTDQMLADVLQSVIYFTYGTPILLEPTSATDAIGTNGKAFEDALKEKIDHPELSDKWFFWNSFSYSEIVATALTLNYTETKLRENNETLLDWVTNRDKFHRNGSYIYTIIHEALRWLHYKGLNTYETAVVNGRTGKTGFFQMQFDKSRKIRTSQDLTAAFRTVPIATYDSSLQNPTIVKGPGKITWRTPKGHTPYDSLRIVQLEEPVISPLASAILFSMASFLLLCNFGILALHLAKIRKPEVADLLPLHSSLILLGNLFTLCFVLLLPVSIDRDASIHCVASGFFLVFGFSLLTTSIVAKLHVAFRVSCYEMAARAAKIAKRRLKFTLLQMLGNSPAISPAQSFCSAHSQKPAPQQMETENSRSLARRSRDIIKLYQTLGTRIPGTSRRTLFSSVGWTFVQTLLVAIWFALEPPRTESINRKLEASEDDPGLAYQHVTYACRLDTTELTSQFFIAALLLCYALVVLRSLYESYFLRNAKHKAGSDLDLVRFVSYVIPMVVVAGCVAIWPFFSRNVASLLIAVSTLDLIVVLISTCVLFAPKLRRGHYF